MSLLTYNVTLGVYTWNLPPGNTCPGRTAWCERHCYASKGRFLLQRDSLRWRFVTTTDLDVWEEAMRTEISALAASRGTRSRDKRGRLMIRVHSAGDFYSLMYLRAWARVIASLPHVRFALYTRTWRCGSDWEDALDDLDSLDNVVVWASMDPTSGDAPEGMRRSYVEGTKGAGRVTCKKQTHEGEDCTTCGRCWAPFAHKVTFRVH